MGTNTDFLLSLSIGEQNYIKKLVFLEPDPSLQGHLCVFSLAGSSLLEHEE